MDKKSSRKINGNAWMVFTVLFILVSGCGVTANAEVLSFEQALEKMCRANESLKAAQAGVDKSEYEKKTANGLYFPQIWTQVTHTRINDDITIDLNDIRSLIGTLHGLSPSLLPSFELGVQDAAFSNATLNLLWMVYTGGKISAANKSADAVVQENREKLLYTKSVLTTELAKRYYGYILSKEAQKVRRQVLEGIERHLSQAKKLENNGMLAMSERLHAEVAYSDALRQYKKAVRQTRIAQTGLKNTLSSSETITPVSPLFLTREIKPLQAYMDRAGEQNHLLKQVAAKKEQAAQNYHARKSEHLPQIYLFGKYEVFQDDLTLLQPDWAAGVGVNFSLFEGFSDTHAIMAALKLREQVRYLELKARRDIETLVEKKHDALMMEIEQFEAVEASLKFANENLRVHQRAFKEGMATSLNVVDAQLALSKVKIEKLNAVYGFDVALAELLEVCGLSEHYPAYQNKDDIEVRF